MMTDTAKVKTPKRRQSIVEGGTTPSKKIKNNSPQKQKTPNTPKSPTLQKKLSFAQQDKNNVTPKNKKFNTPKKTPGAFVQNNKKALNNSQSVKEENSTTLQKVKTPKKILPKTEGEVNAQKTAYFLKKKQRIKNRKQKMRELTIQLQEGKIDFEKPIISISKIEKKIEGMEKRENLSKRGNRKLRFFRKLLELRQRMEAGESAAVKSIKVTKSQKKQKPVQAKKLPVQDDSMDVNEENNSSANSTESESDADNVSADSDDAVKEEEDGDSDNEDDDFEDEDEEKKPVENKSQKKTNIPKFPGVQSPKTDVNRGKSRYCVFVGNLPFTAEKGDIMTHFSKVGDIVDVRIPPPAKGETKKRGIAYVEFKDEKTYQKALSLHHTMLGGRRINVEYTMTGKKKGEQQKKEIKNKNAKLHAMRKNGQLAGSPKRPTPQGKAKKQQ